MSTNAFDISSISNRDLQLLYEYRILRRPTDKLTAILGGESFTTSIRQGTELEDSWFTYYLDTIPKADKIPFLEFKVESADDWRALAHLSKAEILDDCIRLYSTAEVPTDMQVHIFWCDSLHQIEGIIDELLKMLGQFNSDFDKLKTDIEYLKEHGAVDSRPEGLVGNLVKIQKTDDHATLVDSFYTIQKPYAERVYVNITQTEIDTMVHTFNKCIEFQFTDRIKRVLQNWNGPVLRLSGAGHIVLKNIKSQILLTNWKGHITITDCPDVHLQAENANKVCSVAHLKILRNSCVYLENQAHYIENVTMLLNSTVRHRRGFVKNISSVGYGCTYWCADTVWIPGINYFNETEHDKNTVYNFNVLDILGTLQHDGNALLIYNTRCIGFKVANADAPSQPQVVQCKWDAAYNGGDNPPIPPVPSDPIIDPGNVSERCHVLYVWLRKSGFSQNHTCGILGNIQVESGFDPNIREDDFSGRKYTLLEMVNYENYGYGLIQWTYAYGHSWLYNWCTANNYDYDTLDGQIRCAAAVPMGYKLSDSVGQGGYDIFGHDGSGTATYNYSVYKDGNSTYGWSGVGAGTAEEVFSRLNALSLREATISWLASMERPNASVIGDRVGKAQAIKERADSEGWESEV